MSGVSEKVKIKEKLKQSNIMVMNIEGGIIHRHPQVSRLRGQNQYPRCVKNQGWSYLRIMQQTETIGTQRRKWCSKGGQIGESPLPPLWSEKSWEM